ncbi:MULTISPECIES: Zn-ribbon domain-containing OB-fold protein [unclassified Haladaptatus]|uniref:Zn-ribbon domain-containing OB-fold protein n=1 Tax=unclassified Haladaptatus TaxID=2622732 RepID=UPI0023E87E18|nr:MULTISPECIES: OB-fold domain-containing protein [unclassified Haladaptatus]
MPAFPATACADCGEVYGFPVVACRACGGESFEVNELPGEGTVYARTTIRVPGADHQGQEPFEVCVVDVADAVRVTARILDNPGLEPDDAVQFVEERDGVFFFEAA